MTTAKQLEVYEKVLSSTLARVIDFVKFAEAKNAALLTFASAWTLAIINLLSWDHPFPERIRPALEVALPLFVAAALVAIWSFLPKRKLEIFHRDPDQAKNFLYFGHIASFDVAAFRERVRERYIPKGEPPITESYLDDLAVQVAVNSKIADRKFTMFNFGAVLTLLAMFVLVLPMIRFAASCIFLNV